VFVIYLLLKKKKPQEEKLTVEEEESIIRDWHPKPLVNPRSKNEEMDLRKDLVLEGKAVSHCKVNGEDCINMLTAGVLEVQAHDEVIEESVKTAQIYGVGSCGPRGFYGSLQPHIDFENAIAKFYRAEAGVLYTSEFQAIATIIPAFVKAGDYLLVDKAVSYAFSNGIGLAKCDVIWFDHNDMTQLKNFLADLQPVFKEKKKRVYLAIEAIYANRGDLAPLDEIMKLKAQYPFRILLEESFSIGVLGKTGRGITEHFGISPNDIEIIAGSCGNALGGMGAFVVGSAEMCDHQRLNCTGYVFSCALPPFLSAGVTKALELFDRTDFVSQLQSNVSLVHKLLGSIRGLINISSKESPFIHLVLRKRMQSRPDEYRLLHKIVNVCIRKTYYFWSFLLYEQRENYS